MFYVPICDEPNKLKSIKLKVKVEIKEENVMLISPVWAQRPTGPLSQRALIGGAQPIYRCRPLVATLYKVVGCRLHESRGLPCAAKPHLHSYRSRVSVQRRKAPHPPPLSLSVTTAVALNHGHRRQFIPPGRR